ncbi:hypothetical protein FGRMN_7653 [Fusarium graminum]|nr:hypothetical protein FGRMN_7653 [Fusarium graminum]
MTSSGRQTFLVANNGRLGFVNPNASVPGLPEGSGAADMSIESEGVRLRAAVSKTAQALGIVATQVPTYRDLAFSLIEESPLKWDLIAFVDAETEPPQESLVPVDAFAADSDRTDWHIHCPEMMRIWKDFCEEVNTAAEGQVAINRMAAPSGPLKSRATFLWHYPTDFSPNQIFSHVMDPGSASLKVQSIKNGMRSDVKTLDLIPIRVEYKKTGPDWEKAYKKWPAIHQACLNLAHKLMESDRFIFAIGKEVFPELIKMMTSQGLTLTFLELAIETKMWEKTPRIWIARDSNLRIRKVIFWTFHGQFSFANKRGDIGAVWDLLYNTGYELAGVPVLNHGYFEWKAGATATRVLDNPTSQVGKITDRDMYNTLMSKEAEEKVACTVELVLQCFPALIAKDPGLVERIKSAVDEKGYSPLHPILQFFQSQELPKIMATKAAKKRDGPALAPEPKRRALNDGQKRGHATKRAQLLSKYNALMQSYEVRQAEAVRFDANKPSKYARALPRIDSMKATYNEENFRLLSTKLSTWVTFYSSEYPRGLRWSLDGGPAIAQPDPYANQIQPGIRILDVTHFRDKAHRIAAVGPVEENENEE